VEKLEPIFGALAMICGIATFIIGLTMQAIKQYKEKRCGISIVFAGLGTITCAVRMVYFILSKAYWTIPPDVIGLCLSSVIIYQYGAYQKKWW
jgi:membrane-bound ClpP family serine protease